MNAHASQHEAARPRSAGGELLGGRSRSNSRISRNLRVDLLTCDGGELVDRLEADASTADREANEGHREAMRAGVETAHGACPGCPVIPLVDKRVPSSQERRHKLLNPPLRHQAAVLGSRTSGAMKETPRSAQSGSVARAKSVVRPHGAWTRGVLLSGRNSALQPCRGRPLRGRQSRLFETAGWILSSARQTP